jgi:ComF family protein
VPAFAPVAYDGPARALVAALKYGGATRLAETMAAQIAAAAPPGLFPATTTLVPVPLHPRRHRRRGYNQAALLASALATRTGRPTAHTLHRPTRSAPQVGRDRQARMTAVAGAITVDDSPPEHAILVDDVITTGATLSACAQALKAAGTTAITAVAYARTPAR